MILNGLSPSKTRTSPATDTECPHRAGRPTLGHQEKGSSLNSVSYGLCVLRQVTTTRPPLTEKSREERDQASRTLHSEREANSKGRQCYTMEGRSVVPGQSLGPGPSRCHHVVSCGTGQEVWGRYPQMSSYVKWSYPSPSGVGLWVGITYSNDFTAK